MRVLELHSDRGCRKGCHPVSITRTDRRGRKSSAHYFSVDEPGAWFDDSWNCHVDGCDHPCGSLQEAVATGARVRYNPRFDGNDKVVLVMQNRPFDPTGYPAS